MNASLVEERATSKIHCEKKKVQLHSKYRERDRFGSKSPIQATFQFLVQNTKLAFFIIIFFFTRTYQFLSGRLKHIKYNYRRFEWK